MRYEFQCSGCLDTKEFYASMAEGPPTNVMCECGLEMIHQFGCNFILKGDGWPGKEIQRDERTAQKVREEIDSQLAEDSRSQRLVDEVVEVRRQGRKATDSLHSDNPQKMKDYKEALKKGYRAKPKSYKIKSDG